MSIPRSIRIIGLVVVAGVVAVTAGTWGYIHLIKDDAPPPLSLDAAGTSATTVTTASPDTTAAARTGVDGTYRVASGSQAGYRVKEVLFGQRADAVGRTSDVTGSITIAGTRVTTASFTVDMTTVASDEARRDNQFKGRIMDVATYPTATFVLTDPIELGTLPAEGKQLTTKATGKLTLHGVTKVVTFTVQAKRTGSTIAIAGSIPVTFADYNISNPSGGPAQTEDSGQVEFLLNLA